MRSDLILAACLLLAGCADSQEANTADDVDDPCGPAEDIKHGGRTVGSAAKTGGTTAVEGVKTVGKTVGGWFEGGKNEAKKQWNEGAAETDETARSGAADTKATAKSHPCP